MQQNILVSKSLLSVKTYECSTRDAIIEHLLESESKKKYITQN